MQWRGIQDAEGTTLDLFGKDINTYRPTKDDPPYRFLIYLKNLLARAQGDHQTELMCCLYDLDIC